jgi:hypothetical protein
MNPLNAPVPLLIAASVIFVSCATGPRQKNIDTEPDENNFAFFPSGAYVYFCADRAKSQELVDAIIPYFIKPDERQKQILEKTGRINVALYKNDIPERPSHFIASLEGESYPVFLISSAFTFSFNWKRIKEKNGFYWRAKNDGFSMAIDSKKIFISDTALFSNQQKTEAPRSYPQFQNGGIISGWMAKADMVNELLKSFGAPLTIPVNELLFVIRSNDYGYELSLRIETQSASVAKAAAALLIIAKHSVSGQGGKEDEAKNLTRLFFANTPVVQGNAIIITTGIMDEKQITGLLPAFMLGLM